MSEFCKYYADGVVLERDKEGNKIPNRPIKRILADGVAKNDQELYGSIHRQNPDLLKCDRLSVTIFPI